MQRGEFFNFVGWCLKGRLKSSTKTSSSKSKTRSKLLSQLLNKSENLVLYALIHVRKFAAGSTMHDLASSVNPTSFWFFEVKVVSLSILRCFRNVETTLLSSSRGRLALVSVPQKPPVIQLMQSLRVAEFSNNLIAF